MTTALVDQVRNLRALLVGDGSGESDDAAVTVDLIAELEGLKSAACAVQADAAVRLDDVRRRRRAADGVAVEHRGRGVASELALARKESPHRGQVLLGFAKVLVTEMPHTRVRLLAGDLNEWRAMVLARETACLSAEQRALVDEKLCADPATLAGVGTGELAGRVRALACRLDPAAMARRAIQAEADRRVTLRPAPDTMSYLTGLLPVAQGVAAYAALGRTADMLRAGGDPRGKGQLMADLLVSRLTGVPMTEPAEPADPADDSDADDPDAADPDAADPHAEDRSVPPPAVPVTVNLTMSDAALLAGGHAAAEVGADGVVPQVIPAEIARLLVSQTLRSGLGAWIRTLYRDPAGRLVAMTSRQRFHPDGLADFLAQRGRGICASPYCDAPIRHFDHIVDADAGGETSADNGQGLCEECNHAKQGTGWRQRPVDDGPTRGVETVTPTGHRYRSNDPPAVA